MKWVLFLLSLIALFVANNALFWLPGKYDWFNFVAAGIAIPAAAAFAWFSSMRFADSTSWKNIVKAPPAVIWIFAMVLFCIFGLMKIVAHRY